MTPFDFQLPEPDLVARIRSGVHAHQAGNAVRDRLAWPTPGTDDAAGAPDHDRRGPRPTVLPSPPRRAGG